MSPCNPRSSLAYTFVILLILSACATEASAKSPYDWCFVRLDYVRGEKVRQFKRLCDRVHETAVRAGADDILLEFFDVNRKYFRLQRKGGRAPEKLLQKIGDFRRAVNDHFIKNYLCFYDILMVDTDGSIFYTIRKEKNFQQNLLSDDLINTPLASCLRADPREETFVDFQYYRASDEPAAFFVEPVSKDGQLLGWIVLQYATNKVNSLFAGTEQLGETGETLLVNNEGYMLTESSFEGDSTILNKKLDDRNVKVKFREKQGHRTVTDYRGFTALTSFEVVEFMGIQWLVVAKVDEAQIITEHFEQHRQYYNDVIVRYWANMPRRIGGEPASQGDRKAAKKVDMDEFIRAHHGELLRTIGVSTCTAVIATYPGKFGYMAHISPLDKVYGGDVTNLLGHVVKKIKTYDIYKYERRRVRFIVVAGHCDSLTNIVDKLVAEGFMLSQMTVLRGPLGHYANVTYDYSRDQISVEWVSEQNRASSVVQYARDAQNIGDIVKRSIDGAKVASDAQGHSEPVDANLDG